ncbi:unnamed protein product [Prunus armeniaca]
MMALAMEKKNAAKTVESSPRSFSVNHLCSDASVPHNGVCQLYLNLVADGRTYLRVHKDDDHVDGEWCLVPRVYIDQMALKDPLITK